MSAQPGIEIVEQLCLGRESEKALFEREFLDRFGDPAFETPLVALLSGQGGIGKSTLLREFVKLASERGDATRLVWLDWESNKRLMQAAGGRSRQGPKPYLDALAGALDKEPGWGSAGVAYYKAADTLVTAYHKVRELSQQGRDEKTRAAEPDAVNAMLLDIRAIIAGTAVTAMAGPVSGALTQGGASALGRAVSLLASVAGAGKLGKDATRALSDPIGQLIAGLAESLRDWAVDRPLLVFLDTYELADAQDVILREVIGRAGPRVGWIIAGRKDLFDSQYDEASGKRHEGYRSTDGGRYHPVPIEVRPLLGGELVGEFFEAFAPDRPELSAEQSERVYAATHGIPLALRTAAEIWRASGSLEEVVVDESTPADEIVRVMVERYLRHCVAEGEEARALMAVALSDGDPLRLDAMIVPEIEGGEGEWAERRGELRSRHAALMRDQAGLRLHDEPRDFFLQHLRTLRGQEDPRWLRELNQRAADALTAKLRGKAEFADRLEEVCEDDEYVRYCGEMARHLFWVEEERAVRWITLRYLEGLAYSPELRQTIQRAAEWMRESLQSHFGRYLKELLGPEGSFFADTDVLMRRAAALEKADRRGWLVGDPVCPRWGDEARAARFWIEAQALLRAEALDRAVDRIEQAAELVRGQEAGLCSSIAAEASAIGRRLWRRKDYEADLRASLVAVQLEPKNDRYQRDLGTTYSKLKRYEDALRHHRKAFEIAPDDANNQRELGNTYGLLKRYEDALRHHLKAVEIAPDDANNQQALGKTYLWLKRHEDALRHHLKTVEIAPDDANNQRALGNTYLWLKRHEDALRHHLRAVEIDPAAADWSSLGYVRAVRGEAEAAFGAFEQSREADDQQLNAYSLEGQLLYRQRRWPEACGRYVEAYQRDATSPSAALGLHAIRRLLDEAASEPSLESLHELNLHPFPEYYGAQLQALAGELDAALGLLEKAIQETPGLSVKARFEPAFHWISQDPHFLALTEDVPGSGWDAVGKGASG